MATTSIEWATDVWNPLAGCSIVSPGCHKCYAMKMAKRLEAMGQEKYRGLTKTVNGNAIWTGKVVFDEKSLGIPLRAKKPKAYFVNSMSDLFHEEVPFTWIDRIFAVMALCPQHTFQVLTKRAERLNAYCAAPDLGNKIYKQVSRWLDDGASGFLGKAWDRAHDLAGAATIESPPQLRWIQWKLPLPNVWLGVSCEDQKRAEERIPWLIKTPAAVRWISAEPLLDRLDLSEWLDVFVPHPVELPNMWRIGSEYSEPQLDWVVYGGESGHGARPCNLDWIRIGVAQCKAAGIPVFVKQLGAKPVGEWGDDPPTYHLTSFRHGMVQETTEISRYKNGAWKLRDKKGGDMREFPQDLQIREMPNVH